MRTYKDLFMEIFEMNKVSCFKLFARYFPTCQMALYELYFLVYISIVVSLVVCHILFISYIYIYIGITSQITINLYYLYRHVSWIAPIFRRNKLILIQKQRKSCSSCLQAGTFTFKLELSLSPHF